VKSDLDQVMADATALPQRIADIAKTFRDVRNSGY